MDKYNKIIGLVLLSFFFIAVSSQAVSSLSSTPSELTFDQGVGESKNLTLVIENNNDYDLTNFDYTFSLSSDFDPKLYLTFNSLEAHSSKTIVVSIKVPDSVSSGKNLAGNLVISANSNGNTELLTVPLYTEIESKLNIKKIRIQAEKEETVSEGESIDVFPGTSVNLTIQLENLFTNEDDELRDVYASIFIDELYGPKTEVFESNSFDLKGRESDKTHISFAIPKNAPDKRYRIDVKAKGYYYNGGYHYATTYFYLKVNREDYAFELSGVVLPDVLKCKEKDARLYLRVTNVGSRYARNLKLTATSPSIALNFNDSFELSDDFDNHKNRYDKQINLALDDFIDSEQNLIFPIKLKLYHDDVLVGEKNIELKHIACPKENLTFEVVYQKPAEKKEELSIEAIKIPKLSIIDIFLISNLFLVLIVLISIMVLVKKGRIRTTGKRRSVIKKASRKKKTSKKKKK